MFVQDLFDLEDDGFDELNDELRISEEVFYGNDALGCTMKCDVDEACGSLSALDKMLEISPCSHSENSAITNQASPICDAASAKLLENSQALSCAKGCITYERFDHDFHTKRMRYSVNELSNFKPYLDKSVASSIPLKQVVSEIHPPTQLAPCQILMCHVVESCNEGVSSSCYLLKQCPESDQAGNLGDSSALNGCVSGSDGSEIKQVGSSKSIASPISQESSATKLLIPNPSVVAGIESGSLQHAEERPNKAFFSECEDEVLTGDIMKDALAILRSRVDLLLERTKWSLEKQVRNDGRYRYVYRSPEGRPVRGFPKVWEILRQSLGVHGSNDVSRDDKQWTNVNEFCSDLYETLRYIDNNGSNWDPKCSLTFLCRLLDPFVDLVFVNRKIHALRTGKLFKARQSSAIDVDRKVEIEARKGDKKRLLNRHAEKMVCDPSLTSSLVETHKTRSIYVSEGNSMRLVTTIADNENQCRGTCTDEKMNSCHLSAVESDGMCLHHPACTYDVPVGSAETNAICRQSSPHQISISTPSSSKQSLEFSKRSLEGGVIDARVKKTYCKSEAFLDISKLYMDDDNDMHLANDRGWPMDCVDIEKQPHECNVFFEPQSCKSEMKPKKLRNSKKRSMGCQPKDDDLLVSAILKKRSFRSSIKDSGTKPRKSKYKYLKKRKTQKGSCRLLLRGIGKGGKNLTDKWTLVGKRTIFSWLISSGTILINEAVQYRDLKDDTVVKEGLITKDGILCNCCSEMFSVSKFKIHAGFNLNRPCLNLFVGSGKPYTLCQLQAWSAEYKVRRSGTGTPLVPLDEYDKNDDSCGLCGEGGELLCCDNCPSTYHQSCLSAEEIPEGSWYCSNCTCQVCGALAVNAGTLNSNSALKCSQCDKKYHEACLMDNDLGKVDGAPWFCSSGCEEIFNGLQSFIGMSNHIADDYCWTVLRCIHDDQKIPSAQRFALKAECNSNLAVAATIMEECFLSMIDPRTGIDMIPQVVYNWGSEFPRLDYHGFYTVVLEKDDVLVSVASIRVHGVAVAEMPLIATCSKYRRQGMCRLLLNSVEKMLISLKVEKLVITAISDVVETWTIGFGFVPVEEEEKRSLNNINLMVFPGTVMLKKMLYVNQATDLQKDVVNGNSEENTLKGNANELKVKLIRFPDMKTSDTQNSGGVAEIESLHLGNLEEVTVTDETTGFRLEEFFDVPVECSMGMNEEAYENENLQSCSLRTAEDESLMDSRVSAVESEIKHGIQDQSNCLEVVKDQDIVDTVERLEIPPARNNASSRAESVSADKPTKLSEVPKCTDCLGVSVFGEKETHVEVTCDVVTNPESLIMESGYMLLPNLENLGVVKGDIQAAEAMDVDTVTDSSKYVATETVNLEAEKEDEQSSGSETVSNVRDNEDVREDEAFTGIKLGAESDTSKIMVSSNSSANTTTKLVHVESGKEAAVQNMESEAVNDSANLVDSEAGNDVKNGSETEISNERDISGTIQEDKETAVEVMETGAEPIGDSESLGKEGSLGKHLSEKFGEYDIGVVIQERDAGEETQSVSFVENQLSLIEQSQEASVFPNS
ncbi:increased DNA methylation 1 [Amaranthus tricolor]|uniref:increased DNA methylation 1 n=1 Tax=Amaranthus tricolor TaxID=29722 RepID=UPI002589C3B2|nr:increased DNA methylation 1 [Amaranthus tricolor]XP_057531302.1 increased DNA methylation 1 [Amaranthus tricolor]XP_057531303.1 increased DNA methylation 1 [Amaranthus tricolor]